MEYWRLRQDRVQPNLTHFHFFNTADFSPEWISIDSPDYENIHTIPAFSFVDQDGDTVTKSTIDGKIVVADFFSPPALESVHD